MDDLSSGGGLVVSDLPIFVVSDSAALDILLDKVPGGGEGLIAVVVELQSLIHVLLNLVVEVSLESEGGDASTNLGNEDTEEEESIHVHHALVLCAGSAASEEADDEDDSTCRKGA